MMRRMMFQFLPFFFMAGTLPALLAAQATTPSVPGVQEPFQTFAALDKQLSVFDKQLAALKASTEQLHVQDRDEKSSRPTRPWIQSSRNLRPTAISISQASYKLYRLYAPRERHLHNQMFTRLYSRSKVLSRDLAKVAHARNRATAKRAEARLSKAMVAFVVQFQRVSGGYAGLHCEPADWGCCEFKQSHYKGSYDSCKWSCVKTIQSCRRGFIGPNILRNFAGRDKRFLTLAPHVRRRYSTK